MSTRKGNVNQPWLLIVSMILMGLFGGLGYLVYRAQHPPFHSEPELMNQLASAELVEQAPLQSEEWPAWRGLRRDGVAHPENLLLDWPATGPKELWQTPIGEGYASIVESGGHTFSIERVADREEVVCRVAETGKEVWRKSYPCNFNNGYGSGPRSTPTIFDNQIFTVGAAGKLQCRDVADGNLVWEHDLLQKYNAPNIKWGVSFSPLVEENYVYTMPGGPGAAFVAFDRQTGTEVWKCGDDPAGYASPIPITVDGTRIIVFFTGKNLVGVEAAAGKVLWSFPWETDYEVNAATPIVFQTKEEDNAGHYIFISSGYDKGCALLKVVPDGKGGFSANRVYEGGQLASQFGSPVRYEDHIYGFDRTRLVCMNLRTGKVMWSKGGGEKTRRFSRGSLLRVGKHLIVLGENGGLAVVKAKPDEFKVVAEAKPLRGKCWTMPTLANGRLYLRGETKLLCFDLSKE